MPKSRNRKNHKKKKEARSKKMIEDRKRFEKQKKDFINELIKKEQEAGKFENNKSIDEIEGPQI
jgi:hypothetical protein